MLLLTLLALAADPPPAPAMVTMVRGSVTLVDAGKRSPAPAPPFILAATQSLDLAADAHVVFLRQGGAFAVDGPKQVDPSSFRTTSNAGDKVGDLLAKRTSLAAAGAARGAGPSITRPVPNANAMVVTEVRWTCDNCGLQTVGIVDLRTDQSVWSGNGTGSAILSGIKLGPGTYAVTVGGTERTFRVVDLAAADAVLASVKADSLANENDRAAAGAGALYLAGYPTDALTMLEQHGLTGMVAEYERLAGVAP
ncbi:hypothetical protein LBMAG42_48960 [Deltaproteobacteria bacterium]|nr:hypothetical protein LBMAG42_48960 [Deltaproteobacteria bacterium]